MRQLEHAGLTWVRQGDDGDDWRARSPSPQWRAYRTAVERASDGYVARITHGRWTTDAVFPTRERAMRAAALMLAVLRGP